MNWNKFWNDYVEKAIIGILLFALAFLLIVGVNVFRSEKQLNDLKAEKLKVEIQMLKADTIKNK